MILLTASNKPLLLAGQVALSSAYVAPVDPPPDLPPGAELPTANAAGHWDVAAMPAGESYLLTDVSGAGKNASVAVQNGTSRVIPRLAGLLPGLHAEGNASNYTVRVPVVLGYAVNAPNIAVGAGARLAVWLVYSRPNLSQPDSAHFSTAPVNLLVVNGVTVLQLAAGGDGNDAITLFPAGANVQAGAFSLRHTRAFLVQFDGAAVSVTLDDGTALFTGVANSLALGATAALSFVPCAGLIFHEAGAYSKALDSTERASWAAYVSGRWPLGARFAAHTLVIGQSNAAIFVGNAFTVTGRALGFMSGCLSANMLIGGTNISGSTTFSGTALYDNSGGLILNSVGGGDPSTWPLGGNGVALMAAIDAMTADDRDNVATLFWFWTESLSAVLNYSKKAEVTAAHQRAWSLIRAKFGRTAAQLPVLLIDPLPFETSQGAQTLREAFADLVADPANAASMMLGLTQDAIGQGDSWDMNTGLESGAGNNSHRTEEDMISFSRRVVGPLARASLSSLAARGRVEPFTALDSSIPLVGGPRVVSAVLEGTGTVLVTLVHDVGTDLVVPLRAALGKGWSVMDGVSDSVAATPGTTAALIPATACVRVSATQLRLSLASAPVHPAKAKLYYGYGNGLDGNQYAIIGRGNAVTDNYKDVVVPANWRIKDFLGAAAQPNNPLQATPYGVALT